MAFAKWKFAYVTGSVGLCDIAYRHSWLYQQGCRKRGGGWPQVLADQLTLSQPEIVPPTLLLAHPALGSFLRHWV